MPRCSARVASVRPAGSRDIGKLVRMFKRIAPILGLIAAYQTAGVLWGRDTKQYALIGMLVLWTVLTFVLAAMRRRLWREHPDVSAALESDTGAQWYWKILDAMFVVILVLGPPLVVSLRRREPLSWESEFTGYHLLAMAGGVGVYLLGRAYVLRQWRLRQR
jgi:hypothetical protein